MGFYGIDFGLPPVNESWASLECKKGGRELDEQKKNCLQRAKICMCEVYKCGFYGREHQLISVICSCHIHTAAPLSCFVCACMWKSEVFYARRVWTTRPARDEIFCYHCTTIAIIRANINWKCVRLFFPFRFFFHYFCHALVSFDLWGICYRLSRRKSCILLFCFIPFSIYRHPFHRTLSIRWRQCDVTLILEHWMMWRDDNGNIVIQLMPFPSTLTNLGFTNKYSELRTCGTDYIQLKLSSCTDNNWFDTRGDVEASISSNWLV